MFYGTFFFLSIVKTVYRISDPGSAITFNAGQLPAHSYKLDSWTDQKFTLINIPL